jgi:small multidrug resistance family-3 protein
MEKIGRSVALFILAGICEIGGGWLVWQWLREHKGGAWGLCGAIVLILYGIIPTFQPAHFGRVYAAYGGFFIVLSLLWGWGIDGDAPTALTSSVPLSVCLASASSCTGHGDTLASLSSFPSPFN